MRLIEWIRLIFVLVGVFAGLLLFGLGSYQTKINPDLQALLTKAHLYELKVILIVMGSLILVSSLIGLVKGLHTSAVGTIILVIILSIITTVVVAMAVLIFANRDEFLKQTGIIYDRTWITRNEPNASHLLHSINQCLRCCGRYSFIDYFPYIPPSCCDAPVNNICPVKDIYLDGCRGALQKFVEKRANLVGYVSVVVALLLLLLILFHSFEYKRRIEPEFPF